MPDAYIERVDIVPDLDTHSLSVTAIGSEATSAKLAAAVVMGNGTVVGVGYGLASNPFDVSMPPLEDLSLWAPDTPSLYDVYVYILNSSLREGPPIMPSFGSTSHDISMPVLDVVQSYTGMRKVSKCRDELGIWRFCLNDVPTFVYGVLY